MLDKFEGFFGGGNISGNFVISFGKKELKEFEIISLSFNYGGNMVNISPKDLEKYFAFSKFSILDTITGKIITIKVDNYHDPKIYARKLLWDELKK